MNLSTELPTGRRGQAFAVAIAVIALALVWIAIAGPLVDWHGSRADRLAGEQAQVDHMVRLVAQLPALEERAKSAPGADAGAGRMLPGASDAVAAAALQNIVQERATSAGLSLTSIEIMPVDPVGNARRIGIKLSFSAAWSVIVPFLSAIEQSNPPLLLDDLQIHGSPLPFSQPTTQLDVSVAVLGFRPASGEATPR